ncbi:MAG: aldose 1-epimerase family protein [Isosphaeraceae bacterium]|nr:aldose 1-epimerase family protein [Isosphaeraceae bacterium]
MPSFVLTDVARDLWVENFALSAPHLGLASPFRWAVSKRALRGGRREGVDLVQLDNGVLSVAILPTRGMGLWKGQYQGDPLGWRSPVHDGPVNPAFVNLAHWGGLGWLEGFDELMVRCGLENLGPPYSDGDRTYTLHGKIANIPATYLAVHVDDKSPFTITVEGHVEESKLFGPQIRMETRVSTVPGSNRLTVRDEFVNLRDAPCEFQVLYHWNLGEPFLEEGARFAAPVGVVVPRDARAAEGIDQFEVYEGPQPGFAEQAYFFDLQTSRRDDRSLALLRNRSGDKGLALRFAKDQLPCFTLWKNSGGRREGFVTGLEPGTSYPNAKPFEQSHRRVPTLPVGGRYVAEMTLDVLNTAAAVAAVEAEIQEIEGQSERKVLRTPTAPYTPAS